MIWMDGFGAWVRKAKLHLNDISEVHKAVSYTHLTLPTT